MSGALGLVGGIPGLVMLGAGAWYAMYQSRASKKISSGICQPNRSDQRKTSSMTLPEVDSNRRLTVEAMQEQKRLIEEQEQSVKKLNGQINDLNESRSKPGITQENDLNIIKAIAILTEQVVVEEDKLRQMREKASDILKAQEEQERRRNDLIKERAWRQNSEYQNLVMMTGKYSEVNRLLGLGNQLLMERQGLVNVPMRMPQADLTSQQANALEKAVRTLNYQSLKEKQGREHG